MNKLEYIIEQSLNALLSEAPGTKETDNAPGSAVDSPFTPAEEKFLGKFDAYGTTHLGIIYSPTDIGIREFMGRSSNDLNLTPGILLSLIRKQIIKLVPYTGFGRNDNYTIELQLSLDDVAGLGAEDKKDVEAGNKSGGGAGAAPAGEPPMPGPEVAWYQPTGDLLQESNLSLHNYTMLMEQQTDIAIKEYMDKNQYTKYIQRAYHFWSKLQYANIGGFNLGESAFFSAFKYLTGEGNVRTNCIFADAISRIITAAQTRRGAGAETTLLTMFKPTYSKLWNVIDIKLPSIESILNDSTIRQYVLNEPNAKTLLKQLDAGGAGSINLNGLRTGTKALHLKLFTPSYTSADVSSIMDKLLYPWTSVKNRSYADSLTPEDQIKRGKWALKKISMQYASKDKLNFYDTVISLSKDYPKSVKFWTDKNGVGFVWFANSSVRLYADGTCIYNNAKTTISRIHSKDSRPDIMSHHVFWYLDTPKEKEINLAAGYI